VAPRVIDSPLQSRISRGLQLLAQFRVLCFQCRYSLLKCCDGGYRVYSLCGSVVRCEGRHTMFSHRFTGCTLGIPHALGSKLELIFAALAAATCSSAAEATAAAALMEMTPDFTGGHQLWRRLLLKFFRSSPPGCYSGVQAFARSSRLLKAGVTGASVMGVEVTVLSLVACGAGSADKASAMASWCARRAEFRVCAKPEHRAESQTHFGARMLVDHPKVHVIHGFGRGTLHVLLNAGRACGRCHSGCGHPPAHHPIARGRPAPFVQDASLQRSMLFRVSGSM